MTDKYIGAEIKKLSNLIRRKTFKIESDEKLNKAVGNQGFIIKFLYDNLNNDIYQKDIELHFKVRRSTVTSQINRMEKAGLVARKSVKTDSRLKKIILTEKGIEIHNYIESRIAKTESLLKSALTKEELSKFLEIVEKLQEVVE